MPTRPRFERPRRLSVAMPVCAATRAATAHVDAVVYPHVGFGISDLFGTNPQRIGGPD